MFDRFTARENRRRPRLAFILSVSFVGHMAVAVGLVVAGFWQIEKLVPPERGITIGVAPRMAKEVKPKTLEPLKKVASKPRATNKVRKELLQPDPNAPDHDSDVEIEYTTAPEDTEPGTGGGGTGGGTGDGPFRIGAPVGPDIPFNEVPNIPKLEKPVEVLDIPAQFLDGQRIAGNERIMPPDSVRIAMHRNEQRRLEGTIKMCLDDRGFVTRLRTLRSTGFQAYDRKLMREMRHWRYHPYKVNGKPVPVCAPIVFIYLMLD